ncbi:MAG TPA: contractile injection system protein, VgrG/Pvc8 family [Thermoanaerobaculia bacterium]|jgi:phage protein D
MPSASNAISYKLTVGGSPIPEELASAIQQVEVEEHAEMAAILRLRAAVGVRPDGSGWTVLDDGTFQRLARVGLSAIAGSSGAQTLIDGYVIESSVTFSPEPGGSVLTVVAMDGSVLMNLEEKVRRWPAAADSDIASTIFGEYGFSARVAATAQAHAEEQQTTMQRGTDIQFLQTLARRNGYECYVEVAADGSETFGFFQPPDMQQPPIGVLSINLGEATNVDAFQLRHDMLRPVHAKVKGLEIEDASEQLITAEGMSLQVLGSDSTVPADQPRTVLLAQTGLAYGGDWQTLAQAVVDRSSWAVTAEGELNTATFGAILRARRMVSVRGIGRLFSGAWYVHRVLHTFSADGHKQRFTLRRNATGLAGNETFTEER